MSENRLRARVPSSPRLPCSRNGAVFRQPTITLRVLNLALSLTRAPVPVYREPSIFLWVSHFALACWTRPIPRNSSIFFRIFYSALARWTRPIAGEAPIAFFILDASLTRRPLAVLRQTLVPRRILNASLASCSHFGTGVAGRSDRLFSHCSHKIRWQTLPRSLV